MGWSEPYDGTTGEVITETIWDTYLKNNLRYLKGLDGAPTIQSGLIIGNTLGTEYFLLPLLTTAQCTSVLGAEGKIAHDSQTHRIKLHDGTAVRSLVSTADVDDTPVDGATTDPISSNYVYDHVAAADPHAGYILETLLTEQGDIIYASAASTPAALPHGTSTQFLKSGGDAANPSWSGLTGVPTTVLKTADETVNNSDVLQNDDELLLAVGANEIWYLFLILRITTTAVADFCFAFALPANGSMRGFKTSHIGDATAAESFILPFNMTAVGSQGIFSSSADKTDAWGLIWGIYIGGNTAGNVQLQWAQGAAEATNTKVLANSFLIANKLA